MMRDDIRNLLEETTQKLEGEGKTTDMVTAVVYFHGNGHQLESTWEEFAALAKAIDYDGGYGGAEILDDLYVLGDDWWLERHEYDGLEWWECKVHPSQRMVPGNVAGGLTRHSIIRKRYGDEE